MIDTRINCLKSLSKDFEVQSSAIALLT